MSESCLHALRPIFRNVLIQHAPGHDGCRCGECREVGDAHDDVSEFDKQGSLKGFCEKIRNHDAGWAVDEIDFAAGNSILDEEVSDVDVDVAGLLSG